MISTRNRTGLEKLGKTVDKLASPGRLGSVRFLGLPDSLDNSAMATMCSYALDMAIRSMMQAIPFPAQHPEPQPRVDPRRALN